MHRRQDTGELGVDAFSALPPDRIVHELRDSEQANQSGNQTDAAARLCIAEIKPRQRIFLAQAEGRAQQTDTRHEQSPRQCTARNRSDCR